MQKADADVVHARSGSYDLEARLASKGESVGGRLLVAAAKLANLQKLEREASRQNGVLVSERDALLEIFQTAHTQLADTMQGEESYCKRLFQHCSEAHDEILTTVHLDLQKRKHR